MAVYPPEEPILTVHSCDGAATVLDIAIVTTEDAPAGILTVEHRQTLQRHQVPLRCFDLSEWASADPDLQVNQVSPDTVEVTVAVSSFSLMTPDLGEYTTVRVTLPHLEECTRYSLQCQATNDVARSDSVSLDYTTLSNLRGELYTWGSNEYGFMGYETNEKTNAPFRHPNMQVELSQVCTFITTNLGLTPAGEVMCWGVYPDEDIAITLPYQLASPVRMRLLCVGEMRMGAISMTGDLYTWGQAEPGQLGHPDITMLRDPKLITKFADDRSTRRYFTDVSAGGLGYLACTDRGELYEWGCCVNPIDGHMVIIDRPHQKTDSGIASLHVLQVSCGLTHYGFVTDEQRCYTWGDNDFGQLGNGSVMPIAIIQNVQVSGVKNVQCGSFHSGCLCEDGSVWLWGKGTLGALADPSYPKRVMSPRKVEGVQARALSVHGQVTMVLLEDGTLLATGEGKNGCLGIGVDGKVGSLRKVRIPPVKYVSLGQSHCLALV